MFNWLLLVGTDSKTELTIQNYDFQEMASVLGIALIVTYILLLIVGIIIYAYINHLKEKIDKLNNKNNEEQ